MVWWARAPRFIRIVHEVKRLVALSCLGIYLLTCPEAAPSVTRHGALQTDRQLTPPRRRGSIASREGEVRLKTINGGRQSNGPLRLLLVVWVVHLILDVKREVPQRAMRRHAARRTRQVALAGSRPSERRQDVAAQVCLLPPCSSGLLLLVATGLFVCCDLLPM